MAGLPPASERGISQRPEIKPFWEVTSEQFQVVMGGESGYYQGASSWVKHSKLPIEVFYGPRGLFEDVKTAAHLRIGFSSTEGIADLIRVDNTVVVLEQEAIIFVRTLDFPDGENGIFWVRVSRGEVETHTRRAREVTDSTILEAARMAETLEIPEWNKIRRVG